MVPNPLKSTSGALLEHFWIPLGVQVAQERQQDLKKLKNVGFLGRPGSLKWTKNQYKIILRIVLFF